MWQHVDLSQGIVTHGMSVIFGLEEILFVLSGKCSNFRSYFRKFYKIRSMDSLALELNSHLSLKLHCTLL